MKTKLATTLSLVGVLSAGSAAALVNTQILNGDQSDAGASAAVLPPAASVQLTIPAIEAPAVTTAADATASTVPTETNAQIALPTATSPVSPASDSTEITAAIAAGERTRSSSLAALPGTTDSTLPSSTLPPASSMLTAFNVGAAGVVTVDVIDGRLILVSAEPSTGWTVTKAEESSSDRVEVYLTSATIRVEFEARLVAGGIVPSVSSSSIGGTTPTNPSTTVPDDDYDDDEYDDDDEDDEDDDDEYDDDEYDDDDEDDRDDD